MNSTETKEERELRLYGERANDKMSHLLIEEYFREQESKGELVISKEGRRKVFEISNEGFEELCDMAKNEPGKWMIYKIRHLFEPHLLELIKKVEDAVHAS